MPPKKKDVWTRRIGREYKKATDEIEELKLEL